MKYISAADEIRDFIIKQGTSTLGQKLVWLYPLGERLFAVEDMGADGVELYVNAKQATTAELKEWILKTAKEK